MSPMGALGFLDQKNKIKMEEGMGRGEERGGGRQKRPPHQLSVLSDRHGKGGGQGCT